MAPWKAKLTEEGFEMQFEIRRNRCSFSIKIPKEPGWAWPSA